MKYIKLKSGERVVLEYAGSLNSPDIKFNTRDMCIWLKWRDSRWFKASSIYKTIFMEELITLLRSKTLEEIKEDIDLYDAELEDLRGFWTHE